MKQLLKRAMLVLAFSFCLFALCACASAADHEQTIDPTYDQAMRQGVEAYLQSFVQMDQAQMEARLDQAVKQKDTVMESAYKSWLGTADELGAYQSQLSEVVERTDAGYRATIRAQFEKRVLSFSLAADETYTNGQAGLVPSEITITPEYSVGEKLKKAGLNTLLGMGTVFLMLIFMSWLISGFKLINKAEAKYKEKKPAVKTSSAAQASVKTAPAAAKPAVPAAAPAPAAQPVAGQKAAPAAAATSAPFPAVSSPAHAVSAAEEPLPAEIVEKPVNKADDLALVAVITAAISAASGVPADELVVRSIRRRSPRRWGRA